MKTSIENILLKAVKFTEKELDKKIKKLKDNYSVMTEMEEKDTYIAQKITKTTITFTFLKLED